MAQKPETQEQNRRLEERMSRIARKLIVMSGKGGVGKTSVAVNLAYVLSRLPRAVGLLDIDLHGPNIVKMLGIERTRLSMSDSGIEPAEAGENLKAVSIALALDNPDRPIVWRGPLKAATIKQFLSDVHWGDLDYLIIDSPPGTGDEPLSACQLIPDIGGAVIVTTPQDLAVLDSRKSILFAQELGVPVIGVIENMSGFTCPHCGKQMNIFKKGGGERAARELGVPFLGSIPFDPEAVEWADRGTPIVDTDPAREHSRRFLEIVERIREYFDRKESTP